MARTGGTLVCLLALLYFQACEGWVNLGAHKRLLSDTHGGIIHKSKGQKAQTGRLFLPLQDTKAMSVALDRSVVPRGFLDTNWSPFLLVLLVISWVTRQDPVPSIKALPMEQLSDAITREMPKSLNRFGDIFSGLFGIIKAPIVKLLSFISVCFRVMLAKIAVTAERLFSHVRQYIDFDPPDIIDIEDWKVCRIEEREVIRGNIVRYRFEMSNDNAQLPLSVGQELMMCAVDPKDRVLKDVFYPISHFHERGFFDVLVRRGDQQQSLFSRNLDTLAIGDEVAIKAGRNRLNNQSPSAEINGISVACAGLGVAPALQVLRGVMGEHPGEGFDMEVLWLNEKEEDFVCEREVESLEFRHIEKLLVTRVVEEDLYSRDIIRNEVVQESITPYEEGRLAVICAPDYVVTSLRQLFEEMGYPAENIITLPID